MNRVNISSQPGPRLSPYLFMQFAEPLGTADSSLDAAWDSLNQCWQQKALAIFKKLSPTMVRWGGCFASYYHWREGVGPRNQRVPMQNLCWDGVYLNQVGTAELAELARSLDAELLLNVNMESDGRTGWARPADGSDRRGTAQEAARWVRYCNAPDDKLRRAHGHPEPFNIKYWQIGNETGYDPTGFDRVQNAAAARRFSRWMRKEDSGLKIIAWGDGPDHEWRPRHDAGGICDYLQYLCETAGNDIDFVAFHNHFAGDSQYTDLGANDYRQDPGRTWELLLRASNDFAARLNYMRRSLKPYPQKLAMTEANLVPPARNRGTLLSSWAAGVMYARCYNILQRNCDLVEIATLADFFGNRWQSNAIILPTPAWTDEQPYLMPVGTIAALFGANIGKRSLAVSGPPGVDLAASTTGRRCYLHAVNTSPASAACLQLYLNEKPLRVPLDILEIAQNPMAEVNELTPEIFAPRHLTSPEALHTLPSAAVAVIAFDLPPDQ